MRQVLSAPSLIFDCYPGTKIDAVDILRQGSDNGQLIQSFPQKVDAVVNLASSFLP